MFYAIYRSTSLYINIVYSHVDNGYIFSTNLVKPLEKNSKGSEFHAHWNSAQKKKTYSIYQAFYNIFLFCIFIK